MKTLDYQVINIYDYHSTKDNFMKFIAEYNAIKLECASLNLPKITSSWSERTSPTNYPESKTEIYVARKIELENKYFEFFDKIKLVFSTLSAEEQAYFVSRFEEGMTEAYYEEKENISHKHLIHLNKSCIIKFATVLGFAVRK